MASFLDRQIALALISQFGEQAVEVFRAELSKIGLPEKYPSGVDIELHNSVAYNINRKDELIITMLEHWFWVVKGRRPQSPRGKNIGPKNPVKPNQKPPPFAAILKWVKEKRKIQFTDRRGRFLSFNQTAWIIRAAVLKNGIAPRNFVTPAVKELERRWGSKIAGQLLEGFIEAAAVDFTRFRIRKTKNIKILKAN